MEPKQSAVTGMYIFFIKYRKIVTVTAIFLLVVGLPSKFYDRPIFDESHKYEDIGFLFDTILMFLITPVWMLVSVCKATKVYKNEDEWKKM
ncbi:hypothetical protein SAMN05216490_0151 [Mucilaginibacter mallensis]|uniref:Uncharacterized protein n=1 Tax=Mucilaginibacter mallensis TaxID=652787 RepID=A0A1H1MSJ9_MUCMA|nr:hypothetical protein [Mucilaginibacter mallensis]SDR89676.1 hypothetical protein SAMN05216490_0151 [Mucilaginibacter mallensis]